MADSLDSMFLLALLFYGSILPASVGASVNVSLARGKPATQSTTLGGNYASFAVDGDYSSFEEDSRCAHTLLASNWWTVDLRDTFAVNEVKMYNRDILKERLDNLTVEAFPVGDPYLCDGHMSLCGFHPGPSGDVVTVNCPSNTIARYIRLRGRASMTLCEVDVFGQALEPSGCKKWNMKRKSGTKLTKKFRVLGTARDPNACMILCQRHHNLCNVFSYNVVDGSCVTPVKPINDNVLTPDGDWNLYYAC